jgi:hypothetical protein
MPDNTTPHYYASFGIRGLSAKTPRKQALILLAAETKRVVAQAPRKLGGNGLRLEQIRNRVFNAAEFHAHN